MTVDRITDWRKASCSGGSGSSCVETSWADNTVGYRDSKQVDGPELWFSEEAAQVFVAWVRQE